MDQRTERLLQGGAPLFDGLTLWTDLLPTDRLRAAIEAIVAVLETYVDNARLVTAEDWHEHDGYISQADDASWAQLRGAFIDDAALHRSSPADDDVRRAWRAQDDMFYLRWLAYDEPPSHDDPPTGGDVDLTASRPIVDAVARHLAELDIEVEIGPAREFFAERWGG